MTRNENLGEKDELGNEGEKNRVKKEKYPDHWLKKEYINGEKDIVHGGKLDSLPTLVSAFS